MREKLIGGMGRGTDTPPKVRPVIHYVVPNGRHDSRPILDAEEFIAGNRVQVGTYPIVALYDSIYVAEGRHGRHEWRKFLLEGRWVVVLCLKRQA